MAQLKIEDKKEEYKKTITIKPIKTAKVIVIILDVLSFLVMGIIFLINFIGSLLSKNPMNQNTILGIGAGIIVITIVNLLILVPRVKITKNQLRKTITVEKRVLWEREPVEFQESDNPTLRLFGQDPIFKTYKFLVISSQDMSKQTTLKPLGSYKSIMNSRNNGWRFSEEDAQKIAEALGLKLDIAEEKGIFVSGFPKQ